MFTILKNSFLLTICFSFLSMYSYAAPTYRMVDLGLQESDQSEAVAVNDQGVVAGVYWMFGEKHYFLWEEKTGIRLIDLPETAVIVVLNNACQIAGNYKDSSGKDKGFVWDPSCGFFDIGTLGGSFTHVYDMNDHGQIVGKSESSNASLVDGTGEQHAFLWQRGFIIDLGALNGDLGVPGDRSVATNINNLGQIIGTSNYLIAHKRTFLRMNNRAVAWNCGIIECFDKDIEPQFGSWAFSISNSGLAAYYNNKEGCFVVNLFTGEKTKTNIQNKFFISDLGDIYFCSQSFNGNDNKALGFVVLKENTESIFSDNPRYDAQVNFSFEAQKGWKPFSGVYDFNNNRWVVGVAENIYRERHGVLLVPVYDQ